MLFLGRFRFRVLMFALILPQKARSSPLGSVLWLDPFLTELASSLATIRMRYYGTRV